MTKQSEELDNIRDGLERFLETLRMDGNVADSTKISIGKENVKGYRVSIVQTFTQRKEFYI